MNYPKKPLSHYHPIMFFMLKSNHTSMAKNLIAFGYNVHELKNLEYKKHLVLMHFFI